MFGSWQAFATAGLETTPIGIGAWSWGDRSGYWGYGNGYTKETNAEAYQSLIDSKIGLIDTAEVYGFGLSEEFIGEFMRNSGTSPAIATKFAPLPWRFTSGSVVDACKYVILDQLEQTIRNML